MKKNCLSLHTVVFFFVFMACNNGEKNPSNKYNNPDNVAGRVEGNGPLTTEMGVEEMLDEDDMVFKDTVPQVFKADFHRVVSAYLDLKDAFVNDNENAIDSKALAMEKLVTAVPGNLLTGEASRYWNEKKGFLLEHLKLYKQAEKEANKRKNFVFLSTVMVKMVKAFGYPQKLYVDYCPMANNNKGAYWLSQTKEIKNPYLGQKMPNCGEVSEKL